MSIVYGALGALFVLALYAAGVLTGWKAHARFYKSTAQSPAEEELKRLRAEQEAFRQMQHYSAETAYGIGSTQDELEGSESA